MSSIGKIYGTSYAPKCARVLAAAKYNGLEIELVKTSAMDGDNKKPEFLKKFPMGKLPTFEGSDNFQLSEGRAIARYVAGLSDNAKLLGTDAKTGALVEQWVSWGDDEVWNPTIAVYLLCKNITPYNKAAETKNWDALKRSLQYLEQYLHTRTFLAGHRVTLADLTVVSNLVFLFKNVAGPEFRASYPNSVRYFNTVVNQAQVKDLFEAASEDVLAAENIKFTPPKKEAAPKPAAAAAPAPAAKKAPKPAAKDDDDDEPSAPAEPKAAHPCASLPPTKMNLDEAKRMYSNKDTKGEDSFLEWFHANYDPEGYSLWRCDFKYPEELTKVFMSANQIGGFFTRLEASRKYVLGAGAVFGEDNNSAIAMAFIVRGQSAEDTLGVAPDFESYSATKLDLSKPEDKKFFEDTLAWEGSIKGPKGDELKLNDNAAKFMK
ncbi:eEF1-gamma domain-containing protein [Tilletiopsis washingtonensis]|uniref:EEF1-gamma domain-containing protein n=1 Tax=Tilletiopsis washingtonensis TaxID=58919 RepID=A0A316ZE66_9BASI|nr:eEF1-gamma domain-containing protein [Tilletiopsis washingtonensis]PWN99821.1 eEF1-gamma domain-containing protein [Tilletiopsis washingtonensis]